MDKHMYPKCEYYNFMGTPTIYARMYVYLRYIGVQAFAYA